MCIKLEINQGYATMHRQPTIKIHIGQKFEDYWEMITVVTRRVITQDTELYRKGGAHTLTPTLCHVGNTCPGDVTITLTFLVLQFRHKLCIMAD